MLAAQKILLSCEEYLTDEALANIRHEYVAGEVYAMAGASERHNRITLNIAFQLRAKARGSQCGGFNDMKLRIQQGERFYYPDVMLGCAQDDSHEFYKDQPCLIGGRSGWPMRKFLACIITCWWKAIAAILSSISGVSVGNGRRVSCKPIKRF